MTKIKLSKKAEGVRLGLYRHYKGGQYEVLGVAFHSETLEEMIVYRATYDEKFLWSRPLSMFLEEVDFEGKKQPRFKFIGSVSKAG